MISVLENRCGGCKRPLSGHNAKDLRLLQEERHNQKKKTLNGWLVYRRLDTGGSTMSIELSLGIMAICQLLITIAIIGGATALIVVLVMSRRALVAKMDELIVRVDPVLEQTKEIAEHVKQTTDKLNTTVESILKRADSTTEKLASGVTCVTSKVAQAVNPQIAGYAAAAVKTYQLIQQVVAARRSAASSEQQPRPESQPESTDQA